MTRKLKQEDLATLTSRWWPYADLETLLELAQFVACIFSTDGMIDQASGPGKDKTQAFQALHRSTDSFVEQRLEMSQAAKKPRSSDSLINSFRVLSELLRKRYTICEYSSGGHSTAEGNQYLTCDDRAAEDVS